MPFAKWQKKILLGIGLLWTSFFAFGVTQQFTTTDYVQKLRHIYPMHMAKAAVRYGDLEKEVFYQPTLPALPGTAQVNTLVVVIGESASSHRWSLLGYQGDDTNQSLRQIAGLRTYKVMAHGLNTAKALPYILTGQSAIDSQKNASPSFLDLAQYAGYKTFVFSNSRFNDKSEDMYSQILRRSADVYAKVGNGAHDEVMTSWLEKALADEAPYKLVVLHTMAVIRTFPSVIHALAIRMVMPTTTRSVTPPTCWPTGSTCWIRQQPSPVRCCMSRIMAWEFLPVSTARAMATTSRCWRYRWRIGPMLP